MKLIIIAAGMGSRLSSVSNGMPKILVNVLGRPLIHQLLENCKKANISDIVIVTGHNNHLVEEYISKIETGINIEFTYNSEWKLANGLSVLAAKHLIPPDHNFLISMSDHYYNSEILIKMKNHSNTKTIASVGSDYKINEIHDIDDGMKIDIDQETKLINAMSKHLKIYNAIDCGIFKCKYNFFNYLELGKKNNNCSLSDACNILIKESLMGSVNIYDSNWIDVDTPEALDYINNNPNKFS